MKIEHVALWTHDLEQSRAFYQTLFGAVANERYESARVRGFASYFLTIPGGETRLELMQLPQLSPMALPPALGYAHLAISVGSREKVDALVELARSAGVPIRSEARVTGDGYYEAVLEDPDGNPVEVTA
ncbi:MAG: VOC family protein [Gemmatimonadaceae bacterium]|nr:VOC family protein [Gemmatimonadaceae bacterium]